CELPMSILRRSVPHRGCGTNAGVSLDRVLAKAVRRQGTRNMLIGNSQFPLDIFVQRLYELCPVKLVAGPHRKTLDVLCISLRPRQCQKARPCMGAVNNVGRRKRKLGAKTALEPV